MLGTDINNAYDNMTRRKSFFEALFDLSFDSSIAVRTIGVIYIVALLVVSLISLTILFGLGSRGGGFILLGLILAPLVWIFYAVLVRIGLEALVASIKTAENTAQMLEIMRRQNPYG